MSVKNVKPVAGSDAGGKARASGGRIFGATDKALITDEVIARTKEFIALLQSWDAVTDDDFVDALIKAMYLGADPAGTLQAAYANYKKSRPNGDMNEFRKCWMKLIAYAIQFGGKTGNAAINRSDEARKEAEELFALFKVNASGDTAGKGANYVTMPRALQTAPHLVANAHATGSIATQNRIAGLPKFLTNTVAGAIVPRILKNIFLPRLITWQGLMGVIFQRGGAKVGGYDNDTVQYLTQIIESNYVPTAEIQKAQPNVEAAYTSSYIEDKTRVEYCISLFKKESENSGKSAEDYMAMMVVAALKCPADYLGSSGDFTNVKAPADIKAFCVAFLSKKQIPSFSAIEAADIPRSPVTFVTKSRKAAPRPPAITSSPPKASSPAVEMGGESDED